MTTPVLGITELAQSQAQPHVLINEAITTFDGIVQLSVVSFAAAPTGAEPTGTRYIVIGGTGAFAGQSSKIAVKTATGWAFYAPLNGWLAFVEDTGASPPEAGRFYYYDLAASPAGWTELQTGAVTGGSGDVATDTIWDAAGDLAVGSGANTAARLAKGSEGQVLSVVSGSVAWANQTGGGAPSPRSLLWVSEFKEEFLTHASVTDNSFNLAAGALKATNNTGLNTQEALASEADHPGIRRITMGGLSNGSYFITAIVNDFNSAATGGWYVTANSTLVFEALIRFSRVPSSTDPYDLYIGLQNLNGATEGIRLYVQWSSPNAVWTPVTTKTSSSTLASYTSPAPTANHWHHVRIVCEGDTSVKYYVDGTLIATHTTNIPTARLFFYNTCVRTGAGANSFTYDVDYIQVVQEWANGRGSTSQAE